eukprot:jgi/Mesvir1/15338/Mv06544-RA.1
MGCAQQHATQPVPGFASQAVRQLVVHVQETFSLDIRSLAIWRVFVGLLLCYECWLWSDGLDLLFQTSGHGAPIAPTDVLDPGIVPGLAGMANATGGPADDHRAEALFHAVVFYRGPYWLQAMLLLLQFLAAACLALGLHTRSSAMVSFALFWAKTGRTSLCASDRVLQLLLLWSMFLPLGRRASLDALRRPDGQGSVVDGSARPWPWPAERYHGAGAVASSHHPGGPTRASMVVSGSPMNVCSDEAHLPQPGCHTDEERTHADRRGHDAARTPVVRSPSHHESGATSQSCSASGSASDGKEHLYFSAATVGVTLQVALVYILVVFNRLYPHAMPEWTPPELSAMYYSLAYGHNVRSLPGELLLYHMPRCVLQFMTAAAMVVEMASPVMVLGTRANRWPRLVPVLLLMSLHMGILAMISPALHPQVGMTSKLLLLPSPFWEWLGKRRSRGSAKAPAHGRDYGRGDTATPARAGLVSDQTGPHRITIHDGREPHDVVAGIDWLGVAFTLYVQGPAAGATSPVCEGDNRGTRLLPLVPCLVSAATFGRVTPHWAPKYSPDELGAGGLATGPVERDGGRLAGTTGCSDAGNVTGPVGNDHGMDRAVGATPRPCWWLTDGKEALTGIAAADKVISLLPGGQLLRARCSWVHDQVAMWLAGVLEWSASTTSSTAVVGSSKLEPIAEVMGVMGPRDVYKNRVVETAAMTANNTFSRGDGGGADAAETRRLVPSNQRTWQNSDVSHNTPVHGCQWHVDLMKVIKGARKSLLRDAWCFVSRSCGQGGIDRGQAANLPREVRSEPDKGGSHSGMQGKTCESTIVPLVDGSPWRPIEHKGAYLCEDLLWSQCLFRNAWWERFVNHYLWRSQRDLDKLPARAWHLGSSFFCSLPDLLQGHPGSLNLPPGMQLVMTEVEIALVNSHVLPPSSATARGPPEILYQAVIPCEYYVKQP